MLQVEIQKNARLENGLSVKLLAKRLSLLWGEDI